MTKCGIMPTGVLPQKGGFMKLRKLLISIVCSGFLLLQTGNAIESREITPIKPVPRELFKPVPEYPQKDELAQVEQNKLTPFKKQVPIKPTTKVVKKVNLGSFLLDKNVSWYGPGFYGKRTACGYALTKTLLGVANKTLPCGTKVTFSWKGRTITVPVVDRGPYVVGRQWDLTGGLCVALHHCFTGPLYYRINR